MDISIISNKNVDKTFEGLDCLLKRSIISTYKEGNTKRYIIKTERCVYEDQQQELVDENGDLVLDENGDPTYETVQILKIIDKKDKESIRIFSFEEINGLYEMIKSQIPSGLPKMVTENLEEQIALLVISQQDKPWGTDAADWILLN